MLNTHIKLLLLTIIFSTQISLNSFAMFNPDEDPAYQGLPTRQVQGVTTNPKIEMDMETQRILKQQQEITESVQTGMANIKPLGLVKDLNEPISMKDDSYHVHDEDHHSNPSPQTKKQQQRNKLKEKEEKQRKDNRCYLQGRVNEY